MKAKVDTEAMMTECRYLQIPQYRACSFGRFLVLMVDLEFESTFSSGLPWVCLFISISNKYSHEIEINLSEE